MYSLQKDYNGSELSKQDGSLARNQRHGIEDGATGHDSTIRKVDSDSGMILPFLYFTQIDVNASLKKKDVKMTHFHILSPTLRT